MFFTDLLRRSLRNLGSAKLRTVLTALAIAIGGFTLTVTLAASQGAREYSKRLVANNFDPNSVTVAKDENFFGNGNNNPQPYSDDLSLERGTPLKQLNTKDVAKLKTLPHVVSVLENYNLNAQFIMRPELDKKYTGSLNVFDRGQRPEMKSGIVSDSLAVGSVLMSDKYVSLFDFPDAAAAVGKTISVQVRRPDGKTQLQTFTIAGITTQSSLAINFTPAGLHLSQDDARTLNDFVTKGTTNAGLIQITTVRGDGAISANDLKKEITSLGLAARTAEDAQKLLSQIINVLQTIILVFGFITLIASFFGVVNTQYISVLERTREIGLMKALGTSRKTISRLFVVEATMIGFIGAALGSLGALALGTAMNPFISKQINFGSERLLIFKPEQIVILVLFLMFVTTVAGLLPARKAAKLDPIEALRTE